MGLKSGQLGFLRAVDEVSLLVLSSVEPGVVCSLLNLHRIYGVLEARRGRTRTFIA